MNTIAAVAAAVAAIAGLTTVIIKWLYGRQRTQREIDRKIDKLKELHNAAKEAYKSGDMDAIARVTAERRRLCKEIGRLRARLGKNN